MHIDFTAALQALGPDAAARIANEVTAGDEYLFAKVLPEQPGINYVVSEKAMTVRSMMAGMVGMDSPYPKTGFAELSSQLNRTIKVANNSTLPEEALRQLQTIFSGGGGNTQALAQEVLNFYDKVVMQPHYDTAEWLRMQALLNSAITWTFNDVQLDVAYNVPDANILTPQTGDDAYNGDTSQFWADVLAAKSLLRYNVEYAIAHPSTIDAIIGNAVNQTIVVGEFGATGILIQQYVGTASGNQNINSDNRYSLALTSYGLEGEIFDPSDPKVPIVIPFMEPGKILFVGKNQYDRVYRVGLGSTVPADFDQAVGYTHIAPTVEGGGTPGRWGRLYVPEERPWQLSAEGVTNLLPVITAPEKIVVAQSTIT